MAKPKKLTPLMEQYFDIRENYPDMLLLFQVGDFYELFFDDAKKAAAYLGIALTKRGNLNGEPIPLCGVPLHALQHYLIKLVRGGFKVAICDQLEEATPGKVVERGVTQVLTPGTLTDTQLLDAKSASYLCSFFPMQDSWGLLFGEILTAQLFGTVIPADDSKKLEAEIARFMPDEIILPHTASGKSFISYFKKLGYFTSLEHNRDDIDGKKEFDGWVEKQLHKKTQKVLTERYSLKSAMHSFYTYLHKNNNQALSQFNAVQCYDADDFLVLDAATQRNLELIKNNHDGSKKGTLFSVLDKAITPMGSRMIKKWITRPLTKLEQIEQRQKVIALFCKQTALVEQLAPYLKEIGDVERVIGRIALRRAQLHDFLALKNALEVLPKITQLLQAYESDVLLQVIMSYIIDFAALHQLLQASIHDDRDKDWLIKPQFDQNLDHLRGLVEHSNDKLLELEQREIAQTGISSLKIRYTSVQGYYIEVTKANLHAVPEHYVRHQTLVGKERYVTVELQRLQVEINEAKRNIGTVEKEIFERIKSEVECKINPLRKLAHALAHLDALFGFSCAASDYDFIQPTFNDHRTIAIEAGRHAVVQTTSQNPFIPNDTLLDDNQSLWIITGPNMGGKSTYLRQVAHICIMAQIGSFVPADSASLSLLDRVFTRIGSGDHLTEGKSTFLVEMEETATICTQATDRSLVILDEVGRGTSTFDGLAIAQSVIEYIYKKVQARCIFATHYHELTQLETIFPGIVSYHAASKKTVNGITFLYKIKRGVADGSFGVQVAKLAQLPKEVIDRSQELLQLLKIKEEQLAQHIGGNADNDITDSYVRLKTEFDSLKNAYNQLQEQNKQLASFAKTMQDINFDELSPKKAFDLLWQMKG
ncbi:MAG: DNA mismatch repair protein MutS [Candidatus Dependentiae bacterium]